MLFNFDDVEEKITKEEILSKVTELDIWRRYVAGFENIDKSFKSELYLDKKPSCRIYSNAQGKLVYKDHGNGDYISSCFDYVQKKFGCSYHECLNIIGRDFNIKKLSATVNPKLLLSNDIGINTTQAHKTKTRIDIVKQGYTSYDYDYWKQFGVSIADLEREEIFSVKYAYLHTSDNQYLYEYRKSNLIYAYKEFNYETNEFIGYRLYFPLSNGNRFINSSNKKGIQGYDKIPESGDVLVLTKSRKDCVCYGLLGIPAISMASETTIPEEELIAVLTARFDRVVVNLDNDEEGVRSTLKIIEKYDLEYYYIDGAKDLSDLIKAKGMEYAKNQIKDRLKI